MRRLTIAFIAAFVLAEGGSAAALQPLTRVVTSPAPVTALSVTGTTVVFAVGRTRESCGSVRLWTTRTGTLRSFGAHTIVGCEEGPSGGFGITSVAVSGGRVLWVTGIGGNITDWQLWTATPTRPAARRLAFASSESGDPPAIVLGQGTHDGVPYAVERTLTFVAPSGRRLFRAAVDSPVRLVTSGASVGTARVLAALADGRVVLFSKTGVALRTDDYPAGEVRAIALGLAGPLVQVGSTVNVGPFAGGTKVVLPAGAAMLDYRQGWVVYRKGAQVRARQIATGQDALLRTISVRPWQAMPFGTDAGASAWAEGRRVRFRPGPLA